MAGSPLVQSPTMTTTPAFSNAAFASFAENKVGRLAPGLWADFILVDRDPLLVTPSELRATKVLETWIAGRKDYSKP